MQVSRTSPDNDRSVSAVVVDSVADALGVSPLELETPLYQVIDPDALNDLFAPTPTTEREPSRVSFTYAECEVTVQGRGEVVVQPTVESDFEQAVN
jgi:hypothetical protein